VVTQSQLLEHLHHLRVQPELKERALADARKIADHLKSRYAVEVIGIGSLFEAGRNFGPGSDLDLVVKGLPPGRYFSILDEAASLTSFELDLIPFESAHAYIIERANTAGRLL
jgi:predicted nucleotidyltransferase